MRHTSLLQFFIIFVSLLGVLCFANDAPVNNGNSAVDSMDFPKLEGRIVNGTEATPGQFPHQVSLRRSYSNAHFCGGSVIDANWILTAAHCVVNSRGVKIPPSSITIVAGQIVLRPPMSSSQKRAAASIIVHNQFDYRSLSNDIALIWFKNALNFNTNTLKPAKLAEKTPTVGKACKVSGWGYRAENTTVSNDLLFVLLPIIKPERCHKLLANEGGLPLGSFCAGYEEGLADACQGDSGGGMMCDQLLTGIVSGGKGCARPALPGFYTAVPSFNKWIKNEMKLFNSTNSNGTHGNSTHKPSGGKNNSNNVYSSFSFYAITIAYTILSYLGLSLRSGM